LAIYFTGVKESQDIKSKIIVESMKFLNNQKISTLLYNFIEDKKERQYRLIILIFFILFAFFLKIPVWSMLSLQNKQ